MSQPQKKMLSVRVLLEDTREALQLELVNGIDESPLPITVTDIHRPGLALAGFMQNYLNERIQVLGETEVLYLNTRPEDVRREAIARLMSVPVVCIIVTRSLEIPADLLLSATQHGVPVLRSSMLTTPFIHELTKYLDDRFAPTTEVHATLVDVYGVGLLFTGRSGIGKSEIALDLVERGHRLVADDTVHVTKIADDCLFMAYSHVAHDCIVGSHCILSNCTALAGHVELGDWVILSGYAGVHQFCKVGAHAFLGNNAAVTRDVPPYLLVAGSPAEPKGVNSEGLKRRGFDATQIANIKSAYRTFYRSGLKRAEAEEQLRTLVAAQPELKPFVDFLAASERSIIR